MLSPGFQGCCDGTLLRSLPLIYVHSRYWAVLIVALKQRRGMKWWTPSHCCFCSWVWEIYLSRVCVLKYFLSQVVQSLHLASFALKQTLPWINWGEQFLKSYTWQTKAVCLLAALFPFLSLSSPCSRMRCYPVKKNKCYMQEECFSSLLPYPNVSYSCLSYSDCIIFSLSLSSKSCQNLHFALQLKLMTTPIHPSDMSVLITPSSFDPSWCHYHTNIFYLVCLQQREPFFRMT